MEKIVVGVDGSQQAAAALRWAVREGSLHGCPVKAVMAWGFLDQHHAAAGARFAPDYDQADAVAALDAFITDAVGPDVAGSVGRCVPCDLAPNALIAAVDEDSLLVVGARGLGGFRGLLLGSVSEHCLHHAPCAVAIVRSEGRATRVPPAGTASAEDVGEAADESEAPVERIVVGVDGSATAQRALRWAYEEAQLRQAAVDVVHAWHVSYLATDRYLATTGNEWDWLEAAGRKTLDAAVDEVDPSGLPEAPSRQLVYGSAAAAIIERARDADLVVVGARGFGGFAGLLLGSVSQQVARHADVPVVVVPHVPG
jgi:nucleotide-binding universal stress UspA family protein